MSVFVCLVDWGVTSYSRVFHFYDDVPVQLLTETILNTTGNKQRQDGTKTGRNTDTTNRSASFPLSLWEHQGNMNLPPTTRYMLDLLFICRWNTIISLTRETDISMQMNKFFVFECCFEYCVKCLRFYKDGASKHVSFRQVSNNVILYDLTFRIKACCSELTVFIITIETFGNCFYIRICIWL